MNVARALFQKSIVWPKKRTEPCQPVRPFPVFENYEKIYFLQDGAALYDNKEKEYNLTKGCLTAGMGEVEKYYGHQALANCCRVTYSFINISTERLRATPIEYIEKVRKRFRPETKEPVTKRCKQSGETQNGFWNNLCIKIRP